MLSGKTHPWKRGTFGNKEVEKSTRKNLEQAIVVTNLTKRDVPVRIVVQPFDKVTCDRLEQCPTAVVINARSLGFG